jgi:hypothetical protein
LLSTPHTHLWVSSTIIAALPNLLSVQQVQRGHHSARLYRVEGTKKLSSSFR